ncbi:MAG: DUF485 domain-containing protein [Candidatus Dormibacteraeota bacterium]|nr:DUF485 domain-containing protein [Candidatus Dormibacteraeota bacterium]
MDSGDRSRGVRTPGSPGSPPGVDAAREASAETSGWQALAASQEFQQLLRARRNFIIPAVAFFLVYYFALPLGNGLAPGLMNTKIIGNINLAYLFALSEFVMAWILAYVYIKRANRVFDPLAAAVRRLAGRSGGRP